MPATEYMVHRQWQKSKILRCADVGPRQIICVMNAKAEGGWSSHLCICHVHITVSPLPPLPPLGPGCFCATHVDILSIKLRLAALLLIQLSPLQLLCLHSRFMHFIFTAFTVHPTLQLPSTLLPVPMPSRKQQSRALHGLPQLPPWEALPLSTATASP